MLSQCTVSIQAKPESGIFMLGTRYAAHSLRTQVEAALKEQAKVCVDFRGVLTTQSFMDEFLGVLIDRYGKEILDRVVLTNCHEDVQTTARFVAVVRSKQIARQN